MKVVIVEDRPWKMEESINQIRAMGAEVSDIIFVRNNIGTDEEVEGRIGKLRSSLGAKVEETDRFGFEKVMDKYYGNKENIFFCDLNLSGDQREYFDERVNVQYATKIMEKESGKLKRIWFYTTAGESTNEQINTHFPERNITVQAIRDNQVLLDTEEIEAILNNYKE